LGTNNGLSGTYFGTSTVSTTNVDSYVFLLAAGCRGTNSTVMGYIGVSGNYWSSTPDATAQGYSLYFNSTNISTGIYMRSDGGNVRCVLSQ